MAAGSKQIPPEDTLANLLLTFTALSGEFPTAQINRLPSTGAYQEKILKSLKGEKLLRTYYRDGLRALRLTTAAKKLLVDKWPDLFLPYLSGSTETNVLKSEVPRRLRLHRMAEVLVTMLNANVLVFPWEKSDLLQQGHLRHGGLYDQKGAEGCAGPGSQYPQAPRHHPG